MSSLRTLAGEIMLPPNRRVLVVEDSAAMREMLRIEMQRIGVTQIDMAEDANIAIRAMGERRYDIVVCDYNLEDGPDGQTLLDRARRERLLARDAVFIMLTAERNYSRVVQIVELAPDDYVVKPFSPGILQERIAVHMSRAIALQPALAALDAGEPDKALAFIESALPKLTRYRRELVRLRVEALAAMQRHDEARAAVDEVLRTAVGRAPRWAMLAAGDAAKGVRHGGAARAAYARLIEAYPHFVTPRDRLADLAIEENDLRAAQEWAAKALELSMTPERYRRVGELAVYAGQHDVAERAYREAFERARYSFFRDASDFAYAAAAAQQQGARDRAQSYLNEGEQQIEKGALGRLLLAAVGAVVETARDRAAALQRDALALLKKLPDGASIPIVGEFVLAECLLKLDQPALALGRLERLGDRIKDTPAAARLDKTVERVRIEVLHKQQWGMTQAEEERERARVAQRAIERNNAAVKLLRENRLDEAMKLLEQAIADDPGNATLLGNAVRAHLARHEREGASGALAQAQALLERAREAGLDAAELAKLDERLDAAGRHSKKWMFGARS